MSWKKRRNGRTYYYRSVRTSAGVRSEYVGRGAIGKLVSESDKRLAQLAKLERRQWAMEVAIANVADHELNQWCSDVRCIVHATLYRWGYHQHRRQWRLAHRRAQTVEISDATEDKTITKARVMELIKAAKLSSAQQDELEVGLKSFPSIVDNLGDIGAILRLQLIANMTQQPGVAVVWNAKVRSLRKEMGYSVAAPAERLVIDTVVTCWLHLQAVEIGYQHFCQIGGNSIQVATWEGRLSSAQNRFARQVELLAKLRYWGSRIHQVNIAHNMIVSNS